MPWKNWVSGQHRVFLLCLWVWAVFPLCGQTTGVIRDVNILGASIYDAPAGVAVDRDHNIYITGTTGSQYFPVTKNVTVLAGNSTRVFVTKFDPSLSRIVFSVLLTGSPTTPTAIGIDPGGNIWLIGKTMANGFVIELDPHGDLVWASSLEAPATALCIDSATGVYVGGSDGSVLHFGFDHALQVTMKLPALDALSPAAIALDAAGNIIVGGTGHMNLQAPVNQGSLDLGGNLFVVRLSPGGDILSLANFGSAGTDAFRAMAVALDGSVSVTGTAGYDVTQDFPTTPGVIDPIAIGPAAFVTTIAADGSRLLSSSFVPELASGACLAPRPTGDTVVVGTGRVSGNTAAGYTAAKLVRFTPLGSYASTWLNWNGGAISCVLDGDRLVVVSNGGSFDWSRWTQPASGNRLDSGISVEKIDLEATGLAPFEIDAGAATITSDLQLDGTYRNSTQLIHFTGSGQVGASVNRGAIDVLEAPASMELTVLGAQVFPNQFWFFSPGQQSGLQLIVADRNMRVPQIVLPALTTFSSTPDQTAATVSIPIRSLVNGEDAPLATVIQLLDPHGYFLIDRSSGTTPFNLNVMVNPSEVPKGDWRATIEVTSIAGDQRFDVLFKNGTPGFTSSANLINFAFDSVTRTSSQTVHLGTTDSLLEFKASINDSRFTVSPSSGVTPMDLTITGTVPASNGPTGAADLHIDNPLAVKLDIPITFVDEASGADAYLACPSRPVPGAPFTCSVPGYMPMPAGGMQFYLGQQRLEVLSIQANAITMRLPAPMARAQQELFATDSQGHRIASTLIGFPLPVWPSWKAFTRMDGTPISSAQPVSPGDHVLVQVSGAGNGTALFDMSFGAKPVKVFRANVDPDNPDLFDIEIVIPRLFDGQHSLWMHMAHGELGPLPVWVKNP